MWPHHSPCGALALCVGPLCALSCSCVTMHSSCPSPTSFSLHTCSCLAPSPRYIPALVGMPAAFWATRGWKHSPESSTALPQTNNSADVFDKCTVFEHFVPTQTLRLQHHTYILRAGLVIHNDSTSTNYYVHNTSCGAAHRPVAVPVLRQTPTASCGACHSCPAMKNTLQGLSTPSTPSCECCQ